jgi:ribosomal protein S21
MSRLRTVAGPLRHYLQSFLAPSVAPEISCPGSLDLSGLFIIPGFQVRHKKSQPRITIDAPEFALGIRDDLAIKEYQKALRETGMQRELKERAFFTKPCQRRRKERSDTVYRIQSRELRRLIKMAMEKKER